MLVLKKHTAILLKKHNRLAIIMIDCDFFGVIYLKMLIICPTFHSYLV